MKCTFSNSLSCCIYFQKKLFWVSVEICKKICHLWVSLCINVIVSVEDANIFPQIHLHWLPWEEWGVNVVAINLYSLLFAVHHTIMQELLMVPFRNLRGYMLHFIWQVLVLFMYIAVVRIQDNIILSGQDSRSEHSENMGFFPKLGPLRRIPICKVSEATKQIFMCKHKVAAKSEATRLMRPYWVEPQKFLTSHMT